MKKTSLKAARELTGLKQKEAAERSGIPLGTLRRWEQGVNEPDIESIIRLADVYGLSTDTLLGSRFAATRRPPAFVEIPLYGAIAAGTPLDMVEVEEVHAVPEELVRMHPDAFLLRVEGESMSRILPNGCYALVDPCDDVDRNGEPYAVCVNGNAATIKRVRKLQNGFELAPDSDDPTFKPVVYDYGVEGTDEVTVIGRVVWYTLPYRWSF